MRVLLDACVPRRLNRELPEHEVRTVPQMGWADLDDGPLLDAMAACNITADWRTKHGKSSARQMPSYSMLKACYFHAMANLQVKDVPEDVRRRLQECARRRGKSLRDLVLEALEKELSHDEFERRLRSRSRVQLSRPAGQVLAEVRAERE